MERDSKGTILLVDDQLELRSIHSAYLQKHGYEVLTASDGESALRCVRERRPDIVFLDHSLRGQTGLEVARELKRDPETANIPIFMLTGHSYGAVGRRALDIGCAGYLSKPVSPQRVLYEVERILGEEHGLSLIHI